MTPHGCLSGIGPSCRRTYHRAERNGACSQRAPTTDWHAIRADPAFELQGETPAARSRNYGSPEYTTIEIVVSLTRIRGIARGRADTDGGRLGRAYPRQQNVGNVVGRRRNAAGGPRRHWQTRTPGLKAGGGKEGEREREGKRRGRHRGGSHGHRRWELPRSLARFDFLPDLGRKRARSLLRAVRPRFSETPEDPRPEGVMGSSDRRFPGCDRVTQTSRPGSDRTAGAQCSHVTAERPSDARPRPRQVPVSGRSVHARDQ